jgi:anti-sigma regulatory factor (Ser/Thr protein kinase)
VFVTSRRGLQLMRTVMDNVSFEENGTVVRMRKRLGCR